MNLAKRLRHMPDVCRKVVLIACTLLCTALFFCLLPCIWPFVTAFLLAEMIEPFVRIATKGFWRWHLPPRRCRMLAVITALMLFLGLFGVLGSALIGWAVAECVDVLKQLPQLANWLYTQAAAILLRLSASASSHLLETLLQQATDWAGTLSACLTSGAWNTAASIPHLFISLVFMLMSAYYFSLDKGRIFTLPPYARQIGACLHKAFVEQLRGQIAVSVMVAFFLMIMLGISSVQHGALLGLLIGAADALPLLGAGLFLLPWSVGSFLTGSSATGIMLLCLYGGTVILRQILQPRIVGEKLGLYPPAAMAAMYAGYRLMGLAGMIAAPFMLMACKAVLEADAAIRKAQQ